jgi:uncharacterized protein
MGFPPLRPRTVRWRPVGATGLEHLDLRPQADRIIAESVVIGQRGGKAYGVRYRVVCDASWIVRSLDLLTTDGRSLAIRSNGAGKWTDLGGRPLQDFDGCTDIDLAGSPFTNTLPIRRLALTSDMGVVELTMLYVPFDTFLPVIDGQRYRCLDVDRRYRYEAADRSFTADLPVDSDGLVLDYPTLFERVEF